MPAPDPLVDPSAVDLTRVVADRAAIRRVLPHRFEFEMLDAVVLVDPADHLVVGYKDVTADEFWCRGHFPGLPVLPGVLMCEAAAQLSAYYAHTQRIVSDVIMGLSGIDDTRFRRAVRPGDRLVLVGKGVRVRPRMTVIAVQGFVGPELAFHTQVVGVPIARAGEPARA